MSIGGRYPVWEPIQRVLKVSVSLGQYRSLCLATKTARRLLCEGSANLGAQIRVWKSISRSDSPSFRVPFQPHPADDSSASAIRQFASTQRVVFVVLFSPAAACKAMEGGVICWIWKEVTINVVCFPLIDWCLSLCRWYRLFGDYPWLKLWLYRFLCCVSPVIAYWLASLELPKRWNLYQLPALEVYNVTEKEPSSTKRDWNVFNNAPSVKCESGMAGAVEDSDHWYSRDIPLSKDAKLGASLAVYVSAIQSVCC